MTRRMTRRRWLTLALGSVGIPLAFAAFIATTGPRRLRRPPLGSLDAATPIPFFIDDGAAEDGFLPGDAELARWALDAWARAAAGRLSFEPAQEADALVRLRWVGPAGGLYGEMRPIDVAGRRGAEVAVTPDTSGLGPGVSMRAAHDPLFRDVVVYLTCVHEIGHALGLPHTTSFDDVMYSFRYGGDIERFFGRHRDRIRAREDIRRLSGLSEADVERLRALYVTGLPSPAQRPPRR